MYLFGLVPLVVYESSTAMLRRKTETSKAIKHTKSRWNRVIKTAIKTVIFYFSHVTR
jgi:predicted transposase YdaD